MPRSRWGAGRTVLLVGESQPVLAAALERAGLLVVPVPGGEAALRALGTREVHAVVLQGPVGREGTDELVRAAARHHPAVPALVLGATATVEEAVAAMQKGASDYVPAPADADVVLLRLRRLVRVDSPAVAAAVLPPGTQAYLGLIGTSPAMRDLLGTLQRISRYTCNVLLLGESGSGKELVARGIHALGPRKQGLFVPINCATLGRDILENELFGHERGAFTGANDRKRGLFELADGGTLFLDEIGEMDVGTQAKLLRVIERSEFRRVGGTEKVKVDLSVVAATNRDLDQAVRQGAFRQDLYYRLKVVTVSVPPLRDRREDIPALVDAFLADFNRRNNGKLLGVAPHVLSRFMDYAWPGNVRELKNAVESAAVMSTSDILDADPLGNDRAPAGGAGAPVLQVPVGTPLRQVERDLILATVARHATRADAARTLGMGLRTLQAKLAEYGVTRTARG